MDALQQGVDVLAVQLRSVSRLPREHQEAVARYGARTTWPAGFGVYERGTPADGIFLVLRGQIVLRTQLGGGRSFVPWLATAGETFGGEGLQIGARYASTARAEEESETLHLSTARFSALVREQPPQALALLRQVMAEHTALLEKFGEHATLTVEQRLIAALLRLAGNRDPTGPGNGHPARSLIPRRLLGELVGATRESISLVLGRLTAEGLIEREGNGLMITDLERLTAKLATSDRAPEISLATEPAVGVAGTFH
ncbi:MAG: Crp/Fnr family transcriptional regulator [Gemmatimonadota bacterium]|nr:Crp/Fnr family transcriptional regulator [Gemmatimonadota bacterium]